MKLKPMADNVLLKAHEAPETTVSGIVLATTPSMASKVSRFMSDFSSVRSRGDA